MHLHSSSNRWSSINLSDAALRRLLVFITEFFAALMDWLFVLLIGTAPRIHFNKMAWIKHGVASSDLWAVHFAIVILAANSEDLPAFQAAYQVCLTVLLHQRRVRFGRHGEHTWQRDGERWRVKQREPGNTVGANESIHTAPEVLAGDSFPIMVKIWSIKCFSIINNYHADSKLSHYHLIVWHPGIKWDLIRWALSIIIISGAHGNHLV